MKLDSKLIFKIIFSISSIIVLIFLIIFLFNNYKDIHLKGILGKLGDKYYQDYYYDEIEGNSDQVKSFLKTFTKKGLKISLETLGSYNGKTSLESIKELELNNCDKNKTYIIIYPQKPYDKDNFKIKKYLEFK